MNGQKKARQRDWSKVNRVSKRQVGIRLTPEEAARLDEILDKTGVSASAYFKAAAFDRPIPKARPKLDANAAMLRQILGHLGKLGSNANQIARRINSGNVRDHQTAHESLEAISFNLTLLRNQILKALAGE